MGGDPFTLAVVGVGAALATGGLAWALRASRRKARHAKVLERSERSSGAEPVSLHPKIDLDACIGTGSCIDVCPEKDVLGLVDGKAKLINPSACIGHGECMRACPVEAIELVIGTEKRGVELPLVDRDFQTSVPGLHIVGELGGMGLIVNAVNQGRQCVEAIAKNPPPRRDGVYQVLIVGAGPSGLAAALAAKAAGLDYVLVEQESVGGTVRSYPRHKIVMTSPAMLPLYGKVQLARTTKEALLELWQTVIGKTGLAVEEGVKVTSLERAPDGTFVVATSAGPRRSARVVLAIGRRGTPRKLGVPGETLDKVVYKLLEPEQYRGTRCLVVGGGDSAVESALMLAAEPGTTVTLCHRGERFDRAKPANQEALEAATKAGKLAVRLKTAPREILSDKVVLTDGVTIDNDYVLVFIGGEMPTAWLNQIGVDLRTLRGEAHPAMRA